MSPKNPAIIRRRVLFGTDPYERHTEKDEGEVNGLGTQVPLFEDEGGACE